MQRILQHSRPIDGHGPAVGSSRHRQRSSFSAGNQSLQTNKQCTYPVFLLSYIENQNLKTNKKRIYSVFSLLRVPNDNGSTKKYWRLVLARSHWGCFTSKFAHFKQNRPHCCKYGLFSAQSGRERGAQHGAQLLDPPPERRVPSN